MVRAQNCKRSLDYLTIDGNESQSHSLSILNRRALAKRAAVWGSALSVPVASYFCPPESDDSAGPGPVCSQIGYAWDASEKK